MITKNYFLGLGSYAEYPAFLDSVVVFNVKSLACPSKGEATLYVQKASVQQNRLVLDGGNGDIVIECESDDVVVTSERTVAKGRFEVFSVLGCEYSTFR